MSTSEGDNGSKSQETQYTNREFMNLQYLINKKKFKE